MRVSKTERDAEIVQRYTAGEPLEDLRKRFKLTRSRIYQILHGANVPLTRQPDAPDRDQFLGVNLSESVKDALRAEAGRRGVSMSALSAEILRDMLVTCGYSIEAEQVNMS